MPPGEHHYDRVMHDAKENIFLVAARRSIDTRLITVEFDADRGPGPHEEHTLTISLRDSPIAVTAYGIPHEWLPISTDFIDTRLSRLAGGLLMDLVGKAQKAGHAL
jgi:hypothetical protein